MSLVLRCAVLGLLFCGFCDVSILSEHGWMAPAGKTPLQDVTAAALGGAILGAGLGIVLALLRGLFRLVLRLNPPSEDEVGAHQRRP